MKKIALLILAFILCNCKNDKSENSQILDKYSVDKKATELYDNAIQAMNLENNEKALELLENAIKIDEKFTSAYFLSIGLYSQKGMFKKAQSNCQKLIDLHPTNLSYLSQNGIIHQLLGENMEAEKNYLKARKILSENENFYWKKYDSLGFAFMLIEIGDSIRGRKLIDFIIERKSKNGIPETELRNYQRTTRGEILNLIRQSIDTIKPKLRKGGEIENIIEDRN